MADTYRTRDIADLLGVAPARVRRFARTGLVDAPRDGGGYRFSFQDLVLIRAATELEAADLSPRQVDRALRELKRQLPGRPLSAVHVSSEGGHVVAREGKTAWEPASGQFVLGIEVVPEPAAAQPLEERSAAEWFEEGCELEAASALEARRSYERALELEPDHAAAHLNLGRLLHEGGQLAAAEAHYRSALAAQPENATAAFNLGVVLEDLGKVERAIEAYLQAVAADPDLADAHYNLSRLYEAAGERSAALRHLRSYGELSRTS